VEPVVKISQPGAKLVANLGVEGAERLVQEQDIWLYGKSAREAHSLPLPTRKLGGIPVRETFELNQIEQLVHALGDLALISPPNAQAKGYIVPHCHVFKGCVVLEHEANVSCARRQFGHVLSSDEDTPAVRPFQPGDDAQKRGLSATAGPQYRRQSSVLDIE
jgi:hypothetical protein